MELGQGQMLPALTHCRRGCEQAGHRNLMQGDWEKIVHVGLHISSTASCVGCQWWRNAESC